MLLQCNMTLATSFSCYGEVQATLQKVQTIAGNIHRKFEIMNTCMTSFHVYRMSQAQSAAGSMSAVSRHCAASLPDLALGDASGMLRLLASNGGGERRCAASSGIITVAASMQLAGPVLKLVHLPQCALAGRPVVDVLAALHVAPGAGGAAAAPSTAPGVVTFLRRTPGSLQHLAAVSGVRDVLAAPSMRLLAHDAAVKLTFDVAAALLMAGSSSHGSGAAAADAADQLGFVIATGMLNHPAGTVPPASLQLVPASLPSGASESSAGGAPAGWLPGARAAHAAPVQQAQLSGLLAVLSSLQHQWHEACSDLKRLRWAAGKRKEMLLCASALLQHVALTRSRRIAPLQLAGNPYCAAHPRQGGVAALLQPSTAAESQPPHAVEPSTARSFFQVCDCRCAVEGCELVVECVLRPADANADVRLLSVTLLLTAGDRPLPCSNIWKVSGLHGLLHVRAVAAGLAALHLPARSSKRQRPLSGDASIMRSSVPRSGIDVQGRIVLVHDMPAVSRVSAPRSSTTSRIDLPPFVLDEAELPRGLQSNALEGSRQPRAWEIQCLHAVASSSAPGFTPALLRLLSEPPLALRVLIHAVAKPRLDEAAVDGVAATGPAFAAGQAHGDGAVELSIRVPSAAAASQMLQFVTKAAADVCPTARVEARQLDVASIGAACGAVNDLADDAELVIRSLSVV